MEYRFSDLFTWSSGKPITPTNGDIPIYGSNGIIGYTEQKKYENKIILGRVGAYCGSVEYCSSAFNATDNTLITTCDTNKIIYKYAYYLLKEYRLNEFAGGSAQPLITQGYLKHLKCKIPTIGKQKQIASILSAYDDAIENNNKRIAILEKMASELYKEWFVRMRFPGYETADFKDSRLGKIPNSFSTIKMNEAFDYYVGGGWGEDESSKDFPIKAYVIRGTDFPRIKVGDISTCPLRYHKTSNYSSRQLNANDILLEVSGGTQEQPVGRTTIISDEILKRFGNSVICASFCKLIRCKSDVVSPKFFYFWMQLLYDTGIIERFQLQSTGIINFKFEYFLRKGDILLPPIELMQQFDNEVTPIMKEIDQLAMLNQNLAKQRDLLLPRLMSGKLEV